MVKGTLLMKNWALKNMKGTRQPAFNKIKRK